MGHGNLYDIGKDLFAMEIEEQTKTIQAFRNGSINVLFSTDVGQEGLDIPECNVIIRSGSPSL